MKATFIKIENYVGKKKLVVILGCIIIFFITLLYLENIYNLTHRPKSSIDSLSTSTISNINKNFMNDMNKKIINGHDEKIIIDNKNNENVTKCWNKEKYTLTEICSKCDSLIKKYVFACYETGYREILTCEKYGQVSRSCPVPNNVLKKQFWTFEICSILLTIIFTSIVYKRKQYLDFQATERLRKQIISG